MAELIDLKSTLFDEIAILLEEARDGNSHTECETIQEVYPPLGVINLAAEAATAVLIAYERGQREKEKEKAGGG